MSADRTTTREFDHLVYVRVFEGCNLECKHCFIPSNPKRMSFDDIKKIPSDLSKAIPLGSRVLIQWHGGEPTLMGAKFIEEAIIEINSDKRFIWSHGIQTNLTTYDESWSHVYKKYFDGEVGVSWDPKIRRVRGGPEIDKNKKFESNFWPQLKRLISDGLRPYMVITATRVLFEEYKNPMVLFDRLTTEGVSHAHLERLTKTGYARESWGEIGVNNAEYSKYMGKWYRAYKLWNDAHPERRISLSPFDGLEEEVLKLNDKSGAGGYGCWSGNCDTTFHTIDGNGYKAGCTAVTSEIDNINSNQKIQWYGTVPKSLMEARAKRKAPCETCDFKTICNTGCLATDKVDESDECSGSSRLFEEVRAHISMKS